MKLTWTQFNVSFADITAAYYARATRTTVSLRVTIKTPMPARTKRFLMEDVKKEAIEHYRNTHSDTEPLTFLVTTAR